MFFHFLSFVNKLFMENNFLTLYRQTAKISAWKEILQNTSLNAFKNVFNIYILSSSYWIVPTVSFTWVRMFQLGRVKLFI